MQRLLKLSRGIDKISGCIGILTMLMIVMAVFISAGNAVSRKAFSLSSNAMLEVQWYLFSGVFLLGAGYTFLRNAHVRIDFISSRLSARTRNMIDVVGIVLVVVPLCVILIRMGMPLLMSAYQTGEMSPDAGGLIRWPVYSMVPIGMGLLLLQSGSEVIKRIAFLLGQGPDPLSEKSEHDEIEVVVEPITSAVEEESRTDREVK